MAALVNRTEEEMPSQEQKLYMMRNKKKQDEETRTYQVTLTNPKASAVRPTRQAHSRLQHN